MEYALIVFSTGEYITFFSILGTAIFGIIKYVQLQKDNLRTEAEKHESSLRNELDRDKLKYDSEVEKERAKVQTELEKEKAKVEADLEKEKIRLETDLEKEKVRVQGEIEKAKERSLGAEAVVHIWKKMQELEDDLERLDKLQGTGDTDIKVLKEVVLKSRDDYKELLKLLLDKFIPSDKH